MNENERHGTFVSGFIANEFNGTGTVGVAFRSKILSYRVDNIDSCTSAEDSCDLLESNITRAIDTAITDGAKVINLSLGSGTDRSGTSFQNALIRAVNAGLVIVVASGNESAAESGWPGRFATDPRFRGRMIVVGASDYQNNMADFSNKAGAVKDFYVTAPGASTKDSAGNFISNARLITDCNAGSCYVVSGTSFAAPHVSGAAALLFQAFPNLNAEQVIDILLTSATDLGATGIDDVYGRGLVNLATAFSPIGTTQSLVNGTELVSINDLNINLSPAMGDAILNSNISYGVYDKYSRSFNQFLNPRLRSSSLNVIPKILKNESLENYSISENGFIGFNTPIEFNKAWGNSPNIETSFFGLTETQTENLKIKFAYGLNGGQAPFAPINKSFSNNRFGLFALNNADKSAALSFDIGNNELSIYNGQSLKDLNGTLLKNENLGSKNLSLLNYKYKINGGNFNFGIGELSEKGSLLSSSWTNIGLSPIAKTEFVNFGFEYEFADLNLNLNSQVGKIKSQAGLINIKESANLSAYGAKLIKNLDNGYFNFAIEQPLRFENGNFNFALANGFIDYNAPMMANNNAYSLVPSGRELRYSINRSFNLNNGYLNFGIGTINNYGHNINAKPENHLYISGQKRF